MNFDDITKRKLQAYKRYRAARVYDEIIRYVNR